MMNKIGLTFLFLAIVLASCSTNSTGFSDKNGVEYKFHAMGDGQVFPKRGDVAYISLSRAEQSQNTVHHSELFLEIKNPHDKHLQQAVAMMNRGDSMSFILQQNHDFIRDSLISVVYHLKLIQILNKKDYANFLLQEEMENKFLHKAKEQNSMKAYLKQSKNKGETFYPVDGIQMSVLQWGKGPKIKKGDGVKLKYQGAFIEGEVFDSNLDKEPFEFTYGDQGQVIRGIEIAIAQLSHRGKAKLIIPSQLGFGVNGSSTGIIPPYTPVIYTIEIAEHVKK